MVKASVTISVLVNTLVILSSVTILKSEPLSLIKFKLPDKIKIKTI